MSFVGRLAARQRLRKAARESLAIPPFSRPATDCTPWVIGGLWPTELSTPTDETVALSDHLRSDLQRIAAHANEQLRMLGHSALDNTIRQAHQAATIRQARTHAVRRVEATLRQINIPNAPAASVDSPPQSGTVGPRAPVYQAATATPATKKRKPQLPQPQCPVDDITSWQQPVGEATDIIVVDTNAVSAHPPVVTPAGPPSSAPDEAAARQSITPPVPHRSERHGDIDVGSATQEARDSAADCEPTPERLQRLLGCMVRQEPRLGWAVGQDDDSVPLLVTDLACGWIPAGIGLPDGVRVLEPASRSGDLLALLGDVACAATFSPGDAVAVGEDAARSVGTSRSVRALQLPMVDGLDWELSRATHWRDGLPPIVHTMITAAARGFGVVDDEVALLQARLGSLREQALDQYPRVDRELVRNWTLLAAALAYVRGEATAANYHFAWSQAL